MPCRSATRAARGYHFVRQYADAAVARDNMVLGPATGSRYSFARWINRRRESPSPMHFLAPITRAKVADATVCEAPMRCRKPENPE